MLVEGRTIDYGAHFYYYDNDNKMQNEIAIYTNETTYGIYI